MLYRLAIKEILWKANLPELASDDSSSEITPEFLNTPNRSPPELLLQVNVTFSLTLVQRTCHVAKNISVTGKNKTLISAARVSLWNVASYI